MDRPLVALVLPYLERAGTEKHASLLADALSDRYEFILVAPEGPGRVFFPKDLPQLTFTRLEKGFFRGLRELKRAFSQVKEMARSRPTSIHVHAAPELLVISKIVNPGLPHLLTIHGFHGSGMDFSYKCAAWAGNRFAAGVVCVSLDEERRLAAAGLHRRKLNLIYNGIPDLPPGSPAAGGRKEEGVPVIGCVARLVPAKGLEYLLRAAGRLAAEGRDLRVILVGGGPDEERLRRIAGEYPRLRVDFAGAVDDPAPYYAGFDLFVLPSLIDPLPIAAIEAMRAGLPMVASLVGGLPEMVVDGETGFLVPPAQSDALAGAIGRLLEDPALRRRMGEAGRRRFLSLFHLRTMLDSTGAVYARLLEGGRPEIPSSPMV